MKIKIVALVLLLAGCATYTGRMEEPKSVTTMSEPPAPAAVVPYRQFIHAKDIETTLEAKDLQSFVLFTHPPSYKQEKELYVSTCKHWLADLETKNGLERTTIGNVKMTPLYWPTTSARGSCEKDLYEYDYASSAIIAAKIGKAAQTEGPLLVLKQGDSWFVLDISRFNPPDVVRAFFLWKQQVCSANPSNTKFTLGKIREYLRALLNTYGEVVLQTVEKVKG